LATAGLIDLKRVEIFGFSRTCNVMSSEAHTPKSQTNSPNSTVGPIRMA
jgi:hypothetical protein